jgi:pimeloyl-ACP methyl ester carboxylesterase
MGWRARPELDQVRTIQIHGELDRTFPLHLTRPDIIIPSGGHLLPLTHPREIAEVLLEAGLSS